MPLTRIHTYSEATKNIQVFNEELSKSKGLQDRLSSHTAWYYSPEYNLFGPSKFIGYKNTTARSYLSQAAHLNGGDTEWILNRLFNPVSKKEAQYFELKNQLITFLEQYHKSPRSNFRLNFPKPGLIADSPSTRNPAWTRDELILALDLYFQIDPIHTNESHPDIIALSNLLNDLPIHPISTQAQGFRNPNGVYMKLCNFLRLDPSYQGSGLNAGSKLDEEVWNRFYNDRDGLASTAETIKYQYHRISRPQLDTDDALHGDDKEDFPEGKIVSRLHTFKERNSSASNRKKALVLRETGQLKCEVCEFDFALRYGEHGKGFAECHHTRPLSELKQESRTSLKDLTIVCANCHRMLHRIRPCPTIKQLKKLLNPINQV